MLRAEFLRRAVAKHGDRYGYGAIGEVMIPGVKVPIWCSLHDKSYWQDPIDHARGHVGCKECWSLKRSGRRTAVQQVRSRLDLNDEFVRGARFAHGDRYDYSDFLYEKAAVKGKIICPTHGAFWQTPSNHLRGTKCPECALSEKFADSLKLRCRAAGADYHRALKRRQAGAPEEVVLDAGYVRSRRVVGPLEVHGVWYPNLAEAIRVLGAKASATSIARWLKAGMPPELAFGRVANPGYAQGIIYVIVHVETGKMYVGLSVMLQERRLKYHVWQAHAGGVVGQESLHAAIRRFGKNAFAIREIDRGITKVDLEAKERYWIDRLGTHAPQGFNLTAGGESGGSTPRVTSVDGRWFSSRRAAAEYLVIRCDISLAAAKKRLSVGRPLVRKPCKLGQSLVCTPAYKAWSRIKCLTNRESKSYRPELEICPTWHTFDKFLTDVGQPPASGMAFTRLNQDIGFVLSNCRWLSKSESSKINAAQMKAKGTLVGRRGHRRQSEPV